MESAATPPSRTRVRAAETMRSRLRLREIPRPRGGSWVTIACSLPVGPCDQGIPPGGRRYHFVTCWPMDLIEFKELNKQCSYVVVYHTPRGQCRNRDHRVWGPSCPRPGRTRDRSMATKQLRR